MNTQTNTYWTEIMSHRMPEFDELIRLEHYAKSYFLNSSYDDFSSFIANEDRPFGNKNIAQSIIYNLGLDYKRLLTQESLPQELDDYWDNYFENTFKPYIDKNASTYRKSFEDNAALFLSGEISTDNYFSTYNNGYFSSAYKQNILDKYVIENNLFEKYVKLCENKNLIKSCFNHLATQSPESFYGALEHFKPSKYNDTELAVLSCSMIPYYKEIDFLITNYAEDKKYIKSKVISSMAKKDIKIVDLDSSFINDKKEYQDLSLKSLMSYNFNLFAELLDRGHVPLETYKDSKGEHDTTQLLFDRMLNYVHENTQEKIIKSMMTHVPERIIKHMDKVPTIFKPILDSYLLSQKLEKTLEGRQHSHSIKI